MKRLIDVVNEIAALGRTATSVLYDWWIDPLGVFHYDVSASAITKHVVLGKDAESYKCNPDTNEMRNAQWLSGSVSEDNVQVNGWFTDATSINDYGRFDGTLSLSGIVTIADMARIATNMLILAAFPKNKRSVTVWPMRTDITYLDYLGIYGIPGEGEASDKIERITLRETDRGTEMSIEIGGIQPTLADIFGQQAVQQGRREPALDKVKPQVEQYAVDSSIVPDTVEVTLPQKPTGYGQGLRANMVVLNTNTGPMQANINGLGNRPIRMADGTEVPAGMVTAGSIITVVDDGTQLIMTGVPGGGALSFPHNVSHQSGGTDQITTLELDYLDLVGQAAPAAPSADSTRLYVTATGVSPNRIITVSCLTEASEEIIIGAWKT